MQIAYESEKPIFQQISDGLEDAIISGAFKEEEQIPSITEFSILYKINPATALKGINLLVDQGLIYKKRGLGMFVKKGSVKILFEKRKNQFCQNFISNLVEEAKRLNISKEEITKMIERGFKDEH